MSKRSASSKHQLHFHNWRAHPLVLPIFAFLLLFFISLMGMVVSGANTLGATDTKVVSVTVDGEQQSLPTRARTVGELLERLEITVGDKDIVEPSVDTEIRENNFRINYYQARTVVIVDGENEQLLETAAPTPREVVEKAGIEVYPEDIVEKDGTELTDAFDVLTDGVVADRIVVQRSVPVAVNLFGQTFEVRTHAKTIGELVEEQGIRLSEASVFPAPDEPLVADQAIFVTDAGRQIVTEEELIAQAEEQVDDFDLTLGETRVREEGRPGKRVIVYDVANDGSRTILQEVIISQPVTRVVARGQKPPVVVNTSGNAALGQQMAAARGWTGDQWACLYQLWQKESNWNHTAMNRSSGAYGIPQSLPGSKMATAGADWQTNPATQITWGMGYIAGRYGTPCSAWAHSQAVGWY